MEPECKDYVKALAELRTYVQTAGKSERRNEEELLKNLDLIKVHIAQLEERVRELEDELECQ